MPRNKHPEETVKKILDVSLKLFLEKGYENTTVLDIVGSLGGLTRGAFYHHFKSKEEVLDAIFEKNAGDMRLFEQAQHMEGLNGLERIKMLIKVTLKANIDNVRRRDVSNLALSLAENPRFMAEQIKSNQEVAALMAPMIAEGMADGSIKPGNPNFLAELFMLLANFWLFPTYFPASEEQTFEKALMIKDIFESLGCPLIDEEVGEIFTQAYDLMTW